MINILAKKVITWILAFAMILGSVNMTAAAAAEEDGDTAVLLSVGDVVKEGGTYQLSTSAKNGTITVATKEDVTIIGSALSHAYLTIECIVPEVNLTVQDLHIISADDQGTSSLVFTGENNTLTVKGMNHFENCDTGAYPMVALIEVPSGAKLKITGDGVLNLYKHGYAGAMIGANEEKSSGKIEFAGATVLIYTDANSIAVGSDKEADDIIFSGGEVVIASKNAPVVGAVGSNGSSKGGNVYITGGTLTLKNNDGPAFWTNNAENGKIYVSGGSVYDSSTAANTTPVIDEEGNAVYLCQLDLSEITADSTDGYTVQVDGKDFYTGKGYTWAYSATGWVSNTSNSNLYLYVTGENHELTVNGETLYANWNPTSQTFTLSDSEVKADLTGITVTTAPTKTEYTEGDVFDASGMVVTANYSDGTSEVVDAYTYAPTRALTTDDTKVTVSYTQEGVTQTADVAINVGEAPELVDGYYQIDSASDLIWFSDKVLKDNANFASGKAKITTDIVLTNEFVPIGVSKDYPFNGTIDGGGNTITLAGIASSASVGDKEIGIVYEGLVGYASNASVRDLTLAGEINVKKASAYVGSFVAYGAGSSSSIANCVSRVNITSDLSTNAIGGIVGYETSIITVISSCMNYGDISSSASSVYMGGILGRKAIGSAVSVKNCGNEGDIMAAAGGYAAGIAGYSSNNSAYTTKISQCYNAGNIKSATYVGGIAGTGNYMTITDCYNVGEVTSTASAGNSVTAGGISGACGTGSAITNCYNAGTVTSGGTVGALAATITGTGTVSNCYYLETSAEQAYASSTGTGTVSITSVTDRKLKDLASGLSNNFETAAAIANNGYPVLVWQNLGKISLTGITVTTAPARTEYTEGEVFDASGMVVTASYSDGTGKVVDAYTYAPSEALTTDDTKVTVSYTEDGITETADVSITVNKAVSDDGDDDDGDDNDGDNDGEVIILKNGLSDTKDPDGSWYYYTDNKVNYGYTGLAKNKNGWYYVENGKVNFSYTGFAKNTLGDWYVEKGGVKFNKNSVIKDTSGALGTPGTWYYVVKNKVIYTDTVAKNNNGWWVIQNGKVNFGYTGFASNGNGDWYIEKGKVTFAKNSVIKDTTGALEKGTWYYVVKSKVVYTDTVAKNSNGWWVIQNGKVNFGFTGIASNGNGTWYIKGGKVQFGYTGKVTVRGVSYNVVSGKVIG